MTTAELPGNTMTLMESAVFRVLTAGAEFWARVDVTMPQLKVLLLLGSQGSAPVSWLASRMNVSPPNITGILDRLEQRNWVRRTSDQADRRIVRITLTDEGEHLLHELSGAGVDCLRDNVTSLPHKGAEALNRGLSTFLQAVGDADCRMEA